MLYRCADILALHTVYICRRKLACKIRVFRNIFEVSSAKRRTLYVYGRTEQYGYVFCTAFFTERFAHRQHKLTVKAAGGSAGGREAYCFNAFVRVNGINILFAKSVRAVAYHNIGNSETVNFFRVPEIRTRAKTCFFFKCHFRNKFINIVHFTIPFCVKIGYFDDSIITSASGNVYRFFRNFHINST